MRFGENSRKGASSIVIVLFVAVIALAGTTVYVTLDKTVLSDDGYAAAGSTLTYVIESENIIQGVKATVVGYDSNDQTYYFDSGESITSIDKELMLTFLDKEIDDKYIRSSDGTTFVEGIGNLKSTTYTVSISEGNQSLDMKVVTVLNGMVYSAYIDFIFGTNDEEADIHIKLSTMDMDVSLGSYDTLSKSLSLKSGSANATISVISSSINGNYLYRLSTTQDSCYFIGDSDMIPIGTEANGSAEIYSGVTIYSANNEISRIVWDGTTFTPSTA